MVGWLDLSVGLRTRQLLKIIRIRALVRIKPALRACQSVYRGSGE